jgi:hypothetical protein
LTLKQIADFFDISVETVRSAVKRTHPELLKNGIKTELTQSEILQILPKIKIPADRTLRPTKILELPTNNLELSVSELPKKNHDSLLSELIEIKNLLVNQSQVEYYSVAGWCRLQNIDADRAWLNQWGRDCRKLSDAQSVEVRRAEHELYGYINLYHKTILSMVVKNGNSI